jgi:hypothetical protein
VDLSFVFYKVFIDTFFISRFLSAVSYLRKSIFINVLSSRKLRISKKTRTFDNFFVFFESKDVFFKILSSENFLTVFFFLSLKKNIFKKYMIWFFRFNFFPLRDYFLYKNGFFNVNEIEFKFKQVDNYR